jgi:hypothetical protein
MVGIIGHYSTVLDGTVSSSKNYLDGTLPASNHYLKGFSFFARMTSGLLGKEVNQQLYNII